MKKLPRNWLASAALLACCAQAQATLITFDDAVPVDSGGYIVQPYKGFDWFNVSVLNPYAAGGAWVFSGAATGMVSLPRVAYEYSASPIQISSSTPFTINSAYFGALWRDGVTLTLRGLRDGFIVETTSFQVGTEGSELHTLNWSGLDALTIAASGGTDSGNGGHTSAFYFDNLIVNAPVVPEPGALAMLVLGLAGVGLARRARALA